MKLKIMILTSLMVFWTIAARAATLPAGALDPTFGTDKTGTVQTIRNEIDFANAAILQGDKIIVVGYQQIPGKDKNFILARYHANGTVDTTFGDQGFKVQDMSEKNADDEINAVALEGDKILVAGYTTNLNGKKNFAVARFDSNGNLDESFGKKGILKTDIHQIVGGDKPDSIATAIALQEDGKILVGGHEGNFIVVRYQKDGKSMNGSGLDLDFNRSGIALHDFDNKLDGNDTLHTLIIRPDLKIYVSGFSILNNKLVSPLILFGSNGVTEGIGFFPTMSETRSLKIATLPDDRKILAGGTLKTTEMEDADFALFRCRDSNCTGPDNDFGLGGSVKTNIFEGNKTEDRLYSLALQADNKIIAAGTANFPFGASNFALVRYDTQGKLDTDFNKSGIVTTKIGESISNDARAVLIQSDKKIVLVGSTQSSHFALARYFSEPTEVPDELLTPGAGKGSGGCSITSFGNFNLWTILFGLIPLGYFRGRKNRP